MDRPGRQSLSLGRNSLDTVQVLQEAERSERCISRATGAEGADDRSRAPAVVGSSHSLGYKHGSRYRR